MAVLLFLLSTLSTLISVAALAVPRSSLSAPSSKMINENFQVKVNFDNSGNELGYGPSLAFFHSKNVSLLGHEVLESRAPIFFSQDLPEQGCIPHPLISEMQEPPFLCRPEGMEHLNRVFVAALPFSSYAPSQGLTQLTLNVMFQPSTPIGIDQQIVSLAQFLYGSSSVPGESSIISESSATERFVQPTVLALRVEMQAPEGETAIGSCHVRSCRTSIDVADGFTVKNVRISTTIPKSLVKGEVFQMQPADGRTNDELSDDDTLVFEFDSISGKRGRFDAYTNFRWYAGQFERGSNDRVPSLAENNQPRDVRAISEMSADYEPTSTVLRDEADSSVKLRLATVRHLSQFPGYTIRFESSEYWSIDNTTRLESYLPDGMSPVPDSATFDGLEIQPELILNDIGYDAAKSTKGRTLQLFEPGQLPGCTKADLRFSAQLNQNYTDFYETNDLSVDQGDRLFHRLDLYARPVAETIYSFDNTGTRYTVPTGLLTHDLYAIDGVPCEGGPCTEVVHPAGTRLTYRVKYVLPRTAFESLELGWFAQAPLLDVNEADVADSLQVLEGDSEAPESGLLSIGPSDSLSLLMGRAPALSRSLSDNAVQIDYGNFNAPDDNNERRLDLLFTLTLTDNPTPDAFPVTNVVRSAENDRWRVRKTSVATVQMQQPVVSLFAGVIDVREGSQQCPPGNGELEPQPIGIGSFGGRGIADDELCSAGLDSATNVEFIRAGSLIFYGTIVMNVGSATAFRVVVEPPYADSSVVCARREDGSRIDNIRNFALDGGEKAFIVYSFVFGTDQLAGVKRIAEPKISSYTAIDSAAAVNHVDAENVDERQKTNSISELTSSPVRPLLTLETDNFRDTTDNRLKPGELVKFEACVEVPEGYWPEPGLVQMRWPDQLTLTQQLDSYPTISDGRALSGDQLAEPDTLLSDTGIELRFGEVRRRPGAGCNDPDARRACFSLSFCLKRDIQPASTGQTLFTVVDVPTTNGTVTQVSESLRVAMPVLEVDFIHDLKGDGAGLVQAGQEISFQIQISHDPAKSLMRAYALSMVVPFPPELGFVTQLTSSRGSIALVGAGSVLRLALDDIGSSAFEIDDEPIVVSVRAQLRADLHVSGADFFRVNAVVEANSGPVSESVQGVEACAGSVQIRSEASLSLRVSDSDGSWQPCLEMFPRETTVAAWSSMCLSGEVFDSDTGVCVPSVDESVCSLTTLQSLATVNPPSLTEGVGAAGALALQIRHPFTRTRQMTRIVLNENNPACNYPSSKHWMKGIQPSCCYDIYNASIPWFLATGEGDGVGCGLSRTETDNWVIFDGTVDVFFIEQLAPQRHLNVTRELSWRHGFRLRFPKTVSANTSFVQYADPRLLGAVVQQAWNAESLTVDTALRLQLQAPFKVSAMEIVSSPTRIDVSHDESRFQDCEDEWGTEICTQQFGLRLTPTGLVCQVDGEYQFDVSISCQEGVRPADCPIDPDDGAGNRPVRITASLRSEDFCALTESAVAASADLSIHRVFDELNWVFGEVQPSFFQNQPMFFRLKVLAKDGFKLARTTIEEVSLNNTSNDLTLVYSAKDGSDEAWQFSTLFDSASAGAAAAEHVHQFQLTAAPEVFGQVEQDSSATSTISVLCAIEFEGNDGQISRKRQLMQFTRPQNSTDVLATSARFIIEKPLVSMTAGSNAPSLADERIEPSVPRDADDSDYWLLLLCVSVSFCCCLLFFIICLCCRRRNKRPVQNKILKLVKTRI